MTLGNLNFGDSPYSKNDFNLNNYIQTLKTSLNSSQESNIELQNLLKNVQEQKKFLEQQYDNLNQNIEECNLIINGGDGLSQPKIEINNDYIEKCKILEAENETIKQEIENLNNEIENQKKTNENLEQVIDSMNKESYDNEEILQNLKSTIEKLKMQNKQGSMINSQTDLQISKNNNLMQMKQQEIKTLNEKINSLNKELLILKNENKNLLNQMKMKQQENSKGDLINKKLMAEIKNIQDNNKVLEECLKDRQKTINDLKNTLKIMGGLNDQNYENDEILDDNLNEKKKRLQEIINDTKQKEKQYEEIKKNYMDMIKFKDEKIAELKKKLGY